MKTSKKLICFILITMLVGCASKPKEPTLQNQQSNATVFEHLQEIKLSGGEDNGYKMIAYLPGAVDMGTLSYAFGYQSGVAVEVDVNGYNYDKGEYADVAAENLKEEIIDSYGTIDSIYDTAITKEENRETSTFDGVILREDYMGNAQAVYYFGVAKEIDKDKRILVRIEIEADRTNKLTNQIIEELEKYYEIDINFNQEEVNKYAEDYNANPPVTRKTSVLGLTFEIPRRYDIDYKTSSIVNNTYVFGPNGDSTTPGQVLMVVASDIGNVKITKEYLKMAIEEMYDTDIVKITEADIEFNGGEIMKISMGTDLIVIDGYVLTKENKLILVATMSILDKVSDEQMAMIHQVIQTLTIE